MSDLVQRVANMPTDLRTGRALARLTNESRMEQATIRAISMVGEFAISEVQHLKRVQNASETRNVDAADAIALIVEETVISIARRVGRFGQGVDW